MEYWYLGTVMWLEDQEAWMAGENQDPGINKVRESRIQIVIDFVPHISAKATYLDMLSSKTFLI